MSEITYKPGVYISFWHGRNTPDEDMDDWGFEGPIVGPCTLHVTYRSHFKVHDEIDWVADIGFNGDCAVVDGKYYGDFSAAYYDEDKLREQAEQGREIVAPSEELFKLSVPEREA